MSKTTKDERMVTRQLEGARESDLQESFGPIKLKVLATAALKKKKVQQLDVENP